MQFNTNIAALMEHFNTVNATKSTDNFNEYERFVFAEAAMILPRMLYYFAPHISEEIWEKIEGKKMLNEVGLPEFNEDYLVKDEITYVVQIMGKVRGKLEINADASEDEVKKAALEIDNVQKSIEGKTIVKMIVVPKKLVSIVLK
jgi:leucyl-tRNA synthetase